MAGEQLWIVKNKYMEDFKFEEEHKQEDLTVLKKPRRYGWFFFKLFMVLIILGSAFVWWRFFYTYSDGYRSGLLQKVSHKGNFVKTYEGELIMSSVISSNNIALASEKFYFSVANDSIAQVMMSYEGKYVRLHYDQKKGKLPWRGESTYIVDEMQPATPPSSSPGM